MIKNVTIKRLAAIIKYTAASRVLPSSAALLFYYLMPIARKSHNFTFVLS